MKTALLVAIALAVIAAGALIARGLFRRIRLVRRLDRAEGVVSEAMADGRLAAPSGEALLQHLDGLRRTCIRSGEG